jgi:hypothetical protein
LEQQSLAAECAAAKSDAANMRTRVQELADQVENAHERLTELQLSEATDRHALEERHAAQVADMAHGHQAVLLDLQTAHDRTHARLTAELTENGALHARLQEAHAAQEAQRLKLERAQELVHEQEALLEVRCGHGLCDTTKIRGSSIVFFLFPCRLDSSTELAINSLRCSALLVAWVHCLHNGGFCFRR